MFGKRATRTEESAQAGSSNVATSPSNAVELMQERLKRLNDTDTWESTHGKMLVDYNKKSVMFWVLIVVSMCFAILNGYHGWTSSGAQATGISAVIIAILFFCIELTVPMSAHLMTWGAKGQSRWLVRIVGTSAYVLGVGFSLLILQGKFSAGTSVTTIQSELTRTVMNSDTDDLTRARETIKTLRGIVGSSSPESIEANIQSILAKPTTGNKTLSQNTADCGLTRRTAVERDLCSQVDNLRQKKADAVTLAANQAQVSKLTSNLMNENVAAKISANAQDQMLAYMLGTSVENISKVKATLIAVVAALLTHLLWAAHGNAANVTIAKQRDALFERNSLERALARENARAQQTAAETTAAFLVAKGTSAKVAAAVSTAPMKEQPAAVQLQSYFTERTVLSADLTMQVGIIHDDYSLWAKSNNLLALPIDRFVVVVKEIGMGISSDGRIVGAALRGSA